MATLLEPAISALEIPFQLEEHHPAKTAMVLIALHAQLMEPNAQLALPLMVIQMELAISALEIPFQLEEHHPAKTAMVLIALHAQLMELNA